MFYEPLPIGRICRRCGIWKPYHELKKHKHQPDGVERMCLVCNSREAGQYYSNNAEQVKERLRDEYAQFPDRVKARNKRSRDKPEHKIQTLQKVIKWRGQHPDLVKQYQKTWRDTHPDEQQVARERRIARVAELPSTFTVDDWKHCRKYWKGCCAVCNRPKEAQRIIAQDHWIPVTRGGGYTVNNILPLCHGLGGCNNSKHNFEPIQWLTFRLGSGKAKAKLAEIEAYFASVAK